MNDPRTVYTRKSVEASPDAAVLETVADCCLVTKYEANGDLKSFLQKQGAFFDGNAKLTSARKIDIAQQIVQGCLFLSEQKLVSSTSRAYVCRAYCPLLAGRNNFE